MAKKRVMAPKELRPALTAADIQVNKWYRSKNSRIIGGVVNDRKVIHISNFRTQVQYDSSAVKEGRTYPMVSMEAFLKWASHEVG